MIAIVEWLISFYENKIKKNHFLFVYKNNFISLRYRGKRIVVHGL